MTKTVLKFKHLNFEFVSDLDIRISDFHFNIMVKEAKENLTRLPTPSAQADGGRVSRPPVVVILGHVDHGKTTLLDYIRKTNVAEKETGGITQHIGAYEIEVGNPPSSPPTINLRTDKKATEGQRKITFIDTPGHEAFSAMRGRGAKVADIAILVVAAEEGVKPQTKEAILHIKKTGIPMIVAINKIDRPEANPEKVKRELAENGVLVEKLGGKIPSVEISAKTGQRIEDLLELIILVAEMEKLTGDISKTAEGLIIEAYLDSLRGPTATLLLRDGVLKSGDIIGTVSALGKVKTLENFQSFPIKKALPSQPVIVLGFENVPQVGEKFKVFSDIESAKKYIEKKERKAGEGEVFLIEEGQRVLNLILKADVLGSLEAVEEVLKNLPQEKVILRILKKDVGEINESDLKLANSAKATILGFRVKINPIATNLKEQLKVRILVFDIIYELIQGVRSLMEKIMAPEVVKTTIGKVKVLVIFRQEARRQIIGGRVIEGEVKLGLRVEVFRNEEKVSEGRLVNLQKNKKDVEKAIKGEECGILFEGDVKIEEGDILVIYTEERRRGEL